MILETEAAETTGQQAMRGRLLAHDTVRFLLSMESVPKRIRERFWLWGDPKILKLSNINRNDINQFLEAFNFDALIVMGEVINDLPTSDHRDFNKKNKEVSTILQWLNELKQAVKLNLLCATGGEARERHLLATTFSETRGRYEERSAPPPRRWGGLRKG